MRDEIPIADMTKRPTRPTARRRTTHGVSDADRPLSDIDAADLFEPLLGGRRTALLAVSGGADSLALLVLAAEWARSRGGPDIHVATVDHRLRAASRAEAETVADHAVRVGVRHARLSVSLERASRIEEGARRLRYAALGEHARRIGAEAIATAHTLDDQAETVLMRLAAGSGPAGLAAMRAETILEGIVCLRPFLGTPKSRLVATLHARGVTWVEDAMNADPRFARPRLRAARAVLAREGLTPSRLATLAARAARAESALEQATDAAAKAYLEGAGARWIIAAGAVSLPEEIRLRLLARAVAAAGGGVIRLERLERLAARIEAEPSGAATLAGARVAWRPDGHMVATPAPPRQSPSG